VFASLDRTLAVARWFLPLAMIVLPPIVVRVMYALGWTDLDRFVKRDGNMIDRDVVRVVREQRDALPVRVMRQLARDLVTPLSLAVISWIALTIVLGVRTDDIKTLLVGTALGFGYLGLLTVMVAKMRSIDLGTTFEASIVTMGGPIFGGYASAKVRLDSGQLVQLGVPWRPFAAMKRKGTTPRLVLCGKPASPRFVGYRKT
jgi:hypothetical protein